MEKRVILSSARMRLGIMQSNEWRNFRREIWENKKEPENNEMSKSRKYLISAVNQWTDLRLFLKTKNFHISPPPSKKNEIH